MKKNFLAHAAMLLLAVTLFSCSKETPTAVAKTTPESTVTTEATVNTQIPNLFAPNSFAPPVASFWKVGSFMINGINVAYNYNEIKLEFLLENVAMASQYEKPVYGKWFMKTNRQLFISFENPRFPITDLNASWIITRITATSMYLKTDDLLFPKDLRLDMN